MTCPRLHWTTDKPSGKHRCQFQHLCVLILPTKEPINYRGLGGDRTHDLQNTDMHACMHACMHAYTHTYIHIYTYIYIYVCIALHSLKRLFGRQPVSIFVVKGCIYTCQVTLDISWSPVDWGSRKYPEYLKTSDISRTLVGDKIVDNSDVVGASPVGAAPTTSSFST